MRNSGHWSPGEQRSGARTFARCVFHFFLFKCARARATCTWFAENFIFPRRSFTTVFIWIRLLSMRLTVSCPFPGMRDFIIFIFFLFFEKMCNICKQLTDYVGMKWVGNDARKREQRKQAELSARSSWEVFFFNPGTRTDRQRCWWDSRLGKQERRTHSSSAERQNLLS